MEKIVFHNVLPQVFATAQEQVVSDVWQKEVVFDRGRHYLIESESGKGKTTFCSYILGYRHDYSGQVCFDNDDIRRYSISQWTRIRQRHVSCLFQELRLFPELTAYENVDIKNRLTRYKSRQQIETWFERLGIMDKLDAKVMHMSFGQQQRVALIRALAQPFDFILVDEPVSHLDDRNGEQMASLLVEEANSQGASVIATSIGKRISVEYDDILKL